jgi:hypothetical protein
MNQHTTLFDFNCCIGYNTLKEIDMRGSIRALFGLLVVFGVAGAIDTATDAQLLTLIVFAAAGLGIMASGVSAMNSVPAGLSR